MNHDVLEQLAEYGRHVEAAHRPVALSEVLRAADELEPMGEVTLVDARAARRDPAPARPRLLVGVAVAATVVAAVAGVVVLRAGDDDALTDPAPTTSARPTFEPVVPADALGGRTGVEVLPTAETPLPDFDDVVLADSGDPPRVLTSVDDLPESARMDFLATDCGDPVCFRDARFFEGGVRTLTGEWTAGQPFHIRHGFVNDGDEPLGTGFDLAVYAFPLELESGGLDREPLGPTQRYTTDSIVRDETDACGPTYRSQTGLVTCEWFVHDFPNGLPGGRWALWAVWEAPCSAWLDLGLTEGCSDPAEVLSFFSSGVDSPFYSATNGPQPTTPPAVDAGAGEPPSTAPGAVDGGPVVTQVGEWTRIDGLGLAVVVSDGSTFFATTVGTNDLLHSDDGITWSVVAELPSLQLNGSWPKSVAIRDGRFVAVEDGHTSVTVHIVEPDGTVSRREVAFEIPPQYLPFHPGLSPSVNILEDGRIVITASYRALVELVELAAIGVPLDELLSAADAEGDECGRDCDVVFRELVAEHFGVPLESIDDGPTHVDTDVVRVVIDGVEQDYTFDFGLDPLWNLPRALVVVSADGETWTQIEGPTDRFLQQVLPARGGLVADTGALVFGVEPGLATSVDGSEWSLVRHPETGEPLQSGQLESSANRTFLPRRDQGGIIQIWEITTDGAVPILQTSEDWGLVMELREGFQVGPVTTGDAGIAFLTAVDAGFDEPLTEASIRSSSLQGGSWANEALPDESITWGTLAVGSTTLLLQTWDADGPTLWVRDFPG